MTPQRALIIRIFAALVTAACLFPPWNRFDLRGHNLGSAGYALLLSPPDGSRLDIARLTVELVVLIVLAAAFLLTAPSTAEGMFAAEKRIAGNLNKKVVSVTSRHRRAFLIAGLIVLATGATTAYQNWQRDKQWAEAARIAEERQRAADAVASSIAQQQYIQSQSQQLAAEKAREELYMLRSWPAQPLSGSTMQLQTALVVDGQATYKLIVRGKPEELETFRLYHPRLSVRLLDSRGAELTTINVDGDGFEKQTNADGGIIALMAAGNFGVSEQTYSMMTGWRVRE